MNKKDAQDLMDTLSEKYKGYENRFWNTNRIEVSIESLDRAMIICYKVGSLHSSNIRRIERGFFMKTLHIPLSYKIDFELKMTQKRLIKENRNEKKLIELQRKYKNN